MIIYHADKILPQSHQTYMDERLNFAVMIAGSFKSSHAESSSTLILPAARVSDACRHKSCRMKPHKIKTKQIEQIAVSRFQNAGAGWGLSREAVRTEFYA